MRLDVVILPTSLSRGVYLCETPKQEEVILVMTKSKRLSFLRRFTQQESYLNHEEYEVIFLGVTQQGSYLSHDGVRSYLF